MSTAISLVLSTFKSMWLSLHHLVTSLTCWLKWLSEFEKSAKAESSEYLYRLHKELLLLKSSAYRVNKTPNRTVPWGAPVDVVFIFPWHKTSVLWPAVPRVVDIPNPAGCWYSYLPLCIYRTNGHGPLGGRYTLVWPHYFIVFLDLWYVVSVFQCMKCGVGHINSAAVLIPMFCVNRLDPADLLIRDILSTLWCIAIPILIMI